MNETTVPNPMRRRLFCGACAVPFSALMGGCGKEGGTQASTAPQDFGPATACELDGMLLAEYPGPKAQVHYAGAAAATFFCDTVELFSALLRPEQVREVRAAYVQDMGRADWAQPRGHWVDAKTAWYVVGGRRHGSMGPTFVSFGAEDAARLFHAQQGGQVLRFADIKPEMADLSGGAKQDMKM
jgi:copper chaperone NosL